MPIKVKPRQEIMLDIYFLIGKTILDIIRSCKDISADDCQKHFSNGPDPDSFVIEQGIILPVWGFGWAPNHIYTPFGDITLFLSSTGQDHSWNTCFSQIKKALKLKKIPNSYYYYVEKFHHIDIPPPKMSISQNINSINKNIDLKKWKKKTQKYFK